MIVWSYGGGVQSVAIAVLVAQGRLPRPDMIVFADTSREASETWRYTQAHVLPLLAPLGLTIDIAPHSLSTVDLYSRKGDVLLPAFTATGKLPAFCSVEWKQRVVRRYLRSKGVKQCTIWLGMSTNELERLKHADVAWVTHHWPLCFDVPTDRTGCVALVTAAGLPDPPKSSCWMCPNRLNDQWQQIRGNPEEWNQAVALDREIRERDKRGALYLHWSRVPLEQADLSAAPPPDGGLFAGCDSGYCMM